MNRDLLVAVLAMITGAIPRRAVNEALAAWAFDRRQDLAQVLLDRGAVDRERLQALICLAESHLLGHQGDLRACLDRWNAMGLMQEALTEIDDVGFRTTIGATLGTDLTPPAATGGGEPVETLAADCGPDETAAQPGGAAETGEWGLPTAASGRFVPIRMHAMGGIGQVWVARDVELQREVALKVIQEQFAESVDQRTRFLQEAEITGNLEHPGIVPVYSLGRDADGRPYYAMRFIRGQSLAAEIRQFHLRWRGKEADRGGSAAIWGIEFRQLLGRFLDVCDAIDYAHSRGVLHRDVKPANIMLGRYGETLVVDWGLAKVIGKPDTVPAVAVGELEPGLSATSSRTGSGETLPGTMIGTPSYMSPEQARGTLDEMGVTSDVYSLGATLYEILTGKVAFRGKSASEVLHRVVQGDFRPPRAVVRSVPAALEAICLTAMALERSRRYATVRELAVDIQHWLADEPVAAFPEGRLARAGRWLRRHRTWTYAAAAALIGITIASSVGVFVVERGRRREMQARALAETNYQMARRAVEDYFTRVSEDTLLKEQDSVDSRHLRRELLTTALKYYQEFLGQRSGDPELRRELADAQYRVGQILREMGDSPDDAVKAFAASIEQWERLREERRGDPVVDAGLARAYLSLGEQLAWIHNFLPAFEALERSRTILQELREGRMAEVSYRVALADCDRELGIARGDAGAFDRGLLLLKEAEGLLRGLLAEAPGDRGYRKRLADTLSGEGFLYYSKEMDEEARAAFEEFQGLCKGLFDEDPSVRRSAPLMSSLALSYYNVGAILSKQRARHREAMALFEEALRIRRALVASHGTVLDYREKLGVSLVELVPYYHEFGRADDAFRVGNQGIEIFEELSRSQVQQPRYHAYLGRARNMVGFLHDERRENHEAIAVLRRALEEETIAVEKAPEADLYLMTLMTILENLGEQYMDLGTPAEGLPYFRRAVAVQEKRTALRGDARGRMMLADEQAFLARMERHAGEPEAAGKSFGRGLEVLKDTGAEGADPEVAWRRGTLLIGQGRALADRGLDAEALESLRRSVDILESTGPSGSVAVRRRQSLTEALWEIARIRRRGGGSSEADAMDRRCRALWEGQSPSGLAELAMAATAQAALVSYGRPVADERVEAVRRLDLALAAASLRMAVLMGFRDIAALRQSRDAKLLLEREEIRPLLEDLSFPEVPFAPGP